ncbi:MAG: cytochrome c [Gemmatimonadetes bacterium]|nr:cytochrome c [Gemmatimonadota bacterium]
MKVWLRRLAIGLGVLAALVFIAISGVYGLSAAAVGNNHVGKPHPFNSAIGRVAEGERLAAMYGCMECHDRDFGGKLLIDGLPFARVPSSNLTAGRESGALTDEQFEQAVRHGIGADGRALFVMPSAEYVYLSDQDVADILAYLRTVPTVERALPARKFGPVGRALVVAGKVQFAPDLIAATPDAPRLARPSGTDPLRLGYYLTRLCTGCHGPELAGAPPMDPNAPPGANLTPAGHLKNWTREDFLNVMRTGRTPEGKQLDPQIMPWQAIGQQAQPSELDAVWAYLQTLQPKPSPVQQ